MTSAEATQSAVMSLLDVVEELCQGLAAGVQPDREWAQIAADSFADHRKEMRESE